MEPHSAADMDCLLKVNMACETCKFKVKQVLEGVRGVYAITMNAEAGTVRVTGKVNPQSLLAVLAQAGKHAEVSWVSFKGQNMGPGAANNSLYYYQNGQYVPYYPQAQAPGPAQGQLPFYPCPPADLAHHARPGNCSIM